jgi:hypothetical protein
MWVGRKHLFVPPMKGKRMSDESRAKMSAARKGKPGTHTAKHTLESRLKMSKTMRANARRGPANHSFKDGLTAQRRDVRFSAEYARWRYDVFARDHFACQECSDARGGNLHAHHIKSFADFPDLRFDRDNGITLCETCHKERHRRG